jgi:hypothetical protein
VTNSGCAPMRTPTCRVVASSSRRRRARDGAPSSISMNSSMSIALCEQLVSEASRARAHLHRRRAPHFALRHRDGQTARRRPTRRAVVTVSAPNTHARHTRLVDVALDGQCARAHKRVLDGERRQRMRRVKHYVHTHHAHAHAHNAPAIASLAAFSPSTVSNSTLSTNRHLRSS